MRVKVVAAFAAVLVALVALGLWLQTERSRKPEAASEPRSRAELAELRAELSQLQRDVVRNEHVTNERTARAHAQSATSSAPAASAPGNVEQAAVAPRVVRPSLEQQVTRFEKHFANLDALRGQQRDAFLETKFRDVLTNDAALKLSSLGKLKIDEISCGNRLCRVDVDFSDPRVARMGQTELQIQLAPLSKGATIYAEPGTTKLHAYFATGDERLPEFPSVEEVGL